VLIKLVALKDSPFFFVIAAGETNTMLFMGAITDPEWLKKRREKI